MSVIRGYLPSILISPVRCRPPSSVFVGLFVPIPTFVPLSYILESERLDPVHVNFTR